MRQFNLNLLSWQMNGTCHWCICMYIWNFNKYMILCQLWDFKNKSSRSPLLWNGIPINDVIIQMFKNSFDGIQIIISLWRYQKEYILPLLELKDDFNYFPPNTLQMKWLILKPNMMWVGRNLILLHGSNLRGIIWRKSSDYWRITWQIYDTTIHVSFL